VSRFDTALSAVRTVLTVRTGPLLLVVFAVAWPVAGFPWWPIALVVGLAVGLRVLGFGYLLAGRRGPTLLVALLVTTTLGVWSPWLAVTALGAGLAVAGAFRLPRWQLLAVGLSLFCCAGGGWLVQTVLDARNEAARYQQAGDFSRAQMLPRSPREVLGVVIELVGEGSDRSDAVCTLLSTPSAAAQLANAFHAPDCPSAVAAWRARVANPQKYALSPELSGEIGTISPDGETGTLEACSLHWDNWWTGRLPDPGPTAVGHFQLRRVLKQGYVITDYRPC